MTSYKQKKAGKRKDVHEKSCGIILYSEKTGVREYLLLHYPGGHWDFAKGHVEKRDGSEKDTALRELEEETGITSVEFDSGYRMSMYYEFNRGDAERVKKTVVYFLGKTEENKVNISFEHQNFAWLPFAEAEKRLTYDNARSLLQSAQAYLENEL
ncbi:MAG: NUDIX domain-containing protein [Candidatus Gracilibacteria bacterium]|jgi:8-oxo-dGTP pyrophosphatase MutT (NUDIX family)